MVLRPIGSPELSSASERAPVPVWQEIERTQSRHYDECWLITQPAHAALSGEIAANLDPEVFPGVDAEVERAIALHDAGWSPYDAAVIQATRGRSGKGVQPYPFMLAPPKEIVEAWTGSIETATKVTPLSGWLVSSHFSSLVSKSGPDTDSGTARALQRFVEAEEKRRAKLRTRIRRDDGQLQRLVEALQFCDLVSLYICCGLAVNVEFPQKAAGRAIRLIQGDTGLRLEPGVLAGEKMFSVSGLRYPKTKTDPPAATFSVAIS